MLKITANRLAVAHDFGVYYHLSLTFFIGSLLDCYDELGAHYQLPVYCLSPPSNLVKDNASVHNEALEELSEIKPTDP